MEAPEAMDVQKKLDMSLDDLVKMRKKTPKAPREGSDAGKKRKGEETSVLVARRVYVGNLSYRTTWQDLKDYFKRDLKDLFSAQGKVLRADIVMDRNGRSKGYGTVLFDKGEDAQRAIEGMDEATLEGRVLGVKLDKFT
eukprot:jgi/Pico_ML_1/54276/g4648.t1